MGQELIELKKHIFYKLLDIAGRVYIVVGYSDDVVIGERGFLPQERENGLILVFNTKMTFVWNDQGISATLGFGSKIEKCFIPSESIISVFSPELNAQFTVRPDPQDIKPGKKENPPSGEKVIKIDFSKKK